AHRAADIHVQRHDPVCGPHVRAVVEEFRGAGDAVLEQLVTRRLGVALVHDRGDGAGPVCPDGQPLSARGPIADAAVHLLAGQNEFDGSAHLFGGKRRDDLVRPGATRTTESATDERADDPDVLRWDAKCLAVYSLGGVDALRLVPDGQPVAVPAGDGRWQLHRIVVVTDDREPQVRHHVGVMESTVWIAARVILLALPGLRLGLRRVDVADLSGGVVAQRYLRRTVRGGLQRVGDHDPD